jgi:hypothetical protein
MAGSFPLQSDSQPSERRDENAYLSMTIQIHLPKITSRAPGIQRSEGT